MSFKEKKIKFKPWTIIMEPHHSKTSKIATLDFLTCLEQRNCMLINNSRSYNILLQNAPITMGKNIAFRVVMVTYQRQYRKRLGNSKGSVLIIQKKLTFFYPSIAVVFTAFAGIIK